MKKAKDVDEYIADAPKEIQGKLKKLEDLNLEVLGKVIKLAEKSPGLVGAKSV